MNEEVFYRLKEKAKMVEWKKDSRKEKYVLYSITGFSNELKKIAKENGDLVLISTVDT